MKLRSSFFAFFVSVLTLFALSSFVRTASAATCAITTDTVIDQAFVDAGLGSGACTDIEIQANVSTTWIGTVELNSTGTGTITVKTGFTMTMGSSSEMILGATDDFVVEAGATTTHLLEDLNGLRITARNITISGDLSASEKGCRRSGASGDDGYGVDPSTGLCGYRTGGYGRGGEGGGSGGGGGSHAGLGGGGGSSAAGGSLSYGSSILPRYFGSGGGTGYYTTAFGGAGGGILHVTSTGTLTVNGRIMANGGLGMYEGVWNGGGGGAGGSIHIKANALAGLGSIQANGGDGGAGGGGGGGGRVAVYFGTSSLSLSSITASRGAGGAGGVGGTGVNGGYGTTHLLDRVTDDGAGTLTITTGHDFNVDGDYTRDAISIASGAYLTCATTTNLTVSSTAALALSDVTWSCSLPVTSMTLGSSSALSTTSTNISFTAATSISIISPVWSNVTTTITASQAGAYATFDIASDLTLRDFTYTSGLQGSLNALGGSVLFPRAYALTMVSSTLYASASSSLMTGLTIDSRSSINASARGCRGSLTTEDGFGPDTSTGLCTISTSGYGQAGNGGGGGGGGAAHAGTGGASVAGGGAQTTTYGSSTYPILPGSGGGGGYWQAPAAGGNGGGRIFLIISGTATIEGSIKADGGTGLYSGSYNAGGGGSGGSIYLRTGTLAGSGSITANGGSSQTNGGGGGGGGRLSLSYSTLSFSGTSSTTAGTTGGGGAEAGSVGSIYTLQLNTSPDVPSSLGPTGLVNGSTTGTTTPTMTFSLSDPDVSDTVKYRIQIDDSSDFLSPLVDYTSALAAQGASTFQVGQSAGSGTYNITSSSTLPSNSFYWRVKTIDQNNAESSYVAANSGSIAFIVDAATRLLSFQQTTLSALESVTATSVKILLDQTHFETVTVGYSIISASTTANGSGVDYTLAAGTATITAGQTSTTVSLVIVNDSIDEPNETIGVLLSSPTNAVIGSNTSTLYTILDNDTAGVTVTESGGSTAVTEGGATDAFTVVLDTQPTSTVQVLFSTSTNGLTLSTSTLTFTSDNWSSAQTVTVTATDDSVYESTHTTSVAPLLSTTAYGYDALSITSFTVTITDNDTSSITLSASSLSIREGSSGSYTMVLTSAPTSTVQVNLTAGSGVSVSPSTLTFTISDYATPQTVTVSAANDAVFTGNRSASISHAIVSTTDFANVALPDISVSITEDEAQGGGGFAGGAGGGIGSTAPIWMNIPPASIEPINPQASPSLPPPLPPIVIVPTIEELVPESNTIITILNPDDVLSLVEATNGSRDFAQEARYQDFVRQDAREFRIPLSGENSLILSNFITYGISERTRSLGAGERRALVRDAMQTMGTSDILASDLERLTRGAIPTYRNLAIERQQLPRVRQTFRSLYGHDPNFQNPEENLAWNTLMYRIRFERDLQAEQEGIRAFRARFRRDPRDPFQWSVVRVMGYVQR